MSALDPYYMVANAEGLCDVCGLPIDCQSFDNPASGLCACPECMVCGEIGRPQCYEPLSKEGCGLTITITEREANQARLSKLRAAP